MTDRTNQPSREPEREAGVCYLVFNGENQPLSAIFIYLGSLDECMEMQSWLFQETALATAGEKRPARIHVVKLGDDEWSFEA